jgi:hypothetical protein
MSDAITRHRRALRFIGLLVAIAAIWAELAAALIAFGD